MSDLQSNRSSYQGSIVNISIPEVPATASHEYEFPQIENPFGLGSSDKPLGDPKYNAAIPIVICRVCQSKIPLIGYDLEQDYIVKCRSCKEATPIRSAPPGDRYIRCVCNCLLICRKTAAKVACPRLNCQRIIAVASQGSSDEDRKGPTAVEAPPGTCRLVCAHCNQPFIFNVLHKSLTKCPYCSKVSAIDDDYRKKQLKRSVMLAFVFVVMALTVIIGNSLLNESFTGDITLYIFVSAVAVFACIRPVLTVYIKHSQIQGFI